MQRVENDGFGHIEGWMPSADLSHRYAQWCIACFVMVRHLVFMSSGVT